MDTSTLFKTRQLTEYREWPTGEQGCFFYVADAPLEKEYSQGAVYFIDAEYRKGDKVGSYNTLHQSEINRLQNLRPIVKGFAAFLFTQDCNQWIENREILDKWWNLYYEWCQHEHPRIGFETDYILQECQNWTMRSKEIIGCLLYNPDMKYLYRDAMLHVIKYVLYRNTESVADSIKKWHPAIAFKKDNSALKNSYMHYDLFANAMIGETETYALGIQAIILQFSLIHHATQEIGKAQSLDRIVTFLLDKMSESPNNALTMEEVRVPNYDFEKAEKLYEFSWQLNKERMEPLFRRDTSFYAMSDKEQLWGFVNHLYRLEMKHYREKQILSYLSKEESLKMRVLIVGYFVYLYKKLDGSRYAVNVFKELEQVFPELQKNELLSQETIGHVIQQNINVQGDFVAGDKHADVHIENVETLALGDNVKTKIVKGNE